MTELTLSRWQYLELEKLGIGAFYPLQGFMIEDEFRSVVRDMRLPNGSPFPLPVVLDVDGPTAERLRGRPLVTLVYHDEAVGELVPQSIYSCDKPSVARAIYGTDDPAHPGVRFFLAGGDVFVGGPTTLLKRIATEGSDIELTPAETRPLFRRRNWQRIVGFQTRNVPHRAHEYLQRVALEQADGLFIQPLVGRKKRGDYTPDAVLAGYRALIDAIFPRDRVVLGTLTTAMRYAGPREAIFHAIIRRNYGCTHFIVGRDHAGVGNWYGKYEAHELTRRFDGELGIEIMRLRGPYHCRICDGIATEQTCPHGKGAITEISGTEMRAFLSAQTEPPRHLMRPEVIAALKGVPLFIREEEL